MIFSVGKLLEPGYPFITKSFAACRILAFKMADSPVPLADGVGPDYRPKAEKPRATVSTQVSHANVHILAQTPQLIALLTYVYKVSQIRSSIGLSTV